MVTQTFLGTCFLSSLFALILLESLYQSIYSRSKCTVRELISYLRNMDIEELNSLLNLGEEGYLRLNLTAIDFREEQRHRIKLTLEYYGRMMHNALLLQEWSNNEVHKSWKTLNREVNHTSRELCDACAEFRIYTFMTRIKLHIWLFQIKALPFISIPFLAEARRVDNFDFVYSYERIKQNAEKLARICGSTCQKELIQGM